MAALGRPPCLPRDRATPLIASRIVDQRPFVAPFAAEHDDDLLVAIPRRTAIRSQSRSRQRPAISPAVLAEVVGPHRRVIQIQLASPLPPMTTAEQRKPHIPPAHRVKHILVVAANPRRRRIRLLKRPLRGGQIKRPNLCPLLATTSLIVPAIPHEQLVVPIPNTRPLIPQPRRDWSVRQRSALDPDVGGVSGKRR